MNKHLYRLVFQTARGMLVAVPESAAGLGKGRQAGTRCRGAILSRFVPVFWFTPLVAALMSTPAAAQTLPIQVDKTLPGPRPVVGVAANGVPIVNIAPPNRNGGTSVNNFIHYNVGPSGVVLNNAGANSQTQLAGWVQGNMQLGNNRAGVIVNQVTAPNPSQLLGMQEVAGNPATLVIANPAGITCSGCGVIQADRFTLSTGRPVFGADGNLAGFDVREGQISIGGQGLTSPQAQVDLLARSISINAELWAGHLNTIAGANQIHYQSLDATPQAGTGTAPQFALDASALGSMYAGAVRLVGTEKGVGFNIGGDITARAGDIVLDTHGNVRIVSGGRLQAEGSASVAGANIDNAGTITTRGGITATAPGQLTNTGTLAAGTDLLARADRIANTGTIAGTGAASVAAASVVNRGGTLGSTQGSLTVQGALDNTAGKALAAGDLTVARGAIINDHGQLAAGQTLTVDTGGQALVNTSGAIAGGNVHTSTGAFDNRAGVVQSTGLLVSDTHGQRYDNSQGGLTVANGALTLNTGAFNNEGGTVSGQQTLTLAGTTLDNAGGQVVSGGALAMRGESLANSGGQVASNADATLHIANTLDNTRGEVTSGGIALLDIGATTNTDGLLAANTSLDIDSGSLTGDGTLQSQGDIHATLTSDFVNTRAIAAGRNLTVDTTGDVANSGTMAAGAALAVHGRNITNDGELFGQTANTVRADRAMLNRGLIDGGAVRVQAGTTVTNHDRIYGDSVAIGAGQRIVNEVNPATGQGAIIASRAGDVNLGAPDIVNREHSLIYASQDLNVGGTLDAEGKATGQAGSLLNASATIDVVRDANISAATVSNRNDHFSTTRVDAGTESSLTYQLNGSTEDIPADSVIFYHVNNGSWAPGTDPAFLGGDDYIDMVLPSARYPFAEFGPPFDWSRRSDGSIGIGDRPGMGSFGFPTASASRPVGLAYYPAYSVSSGESGSTTDYPEKFIYRPDDAIWDKFGVARPTDAPPKPQPFSCGFFPTPACQAQQAAELAAYQAAYDAWHTATQPLYLELNDKIRAFNEDFNARRVREFWINNKSTHRQEEVVVSTDPGKILVGGNAGFNGEVINDKSQILVGGTLDIHAPVRNLDYDASRIDTTTGTRQWTRIESGSIFGSDERVYDTYVLDPIITPVPMKLGAAVSLWNQGAIAHDGSAPGQGAGAPVLTELDPLSGDIVRVVAPALTLPQSALFRTHPEPGARYLIETDPRFTNQRQWLSSDFMLTQLGQDPNHVLKRLGDGFYEARLVAEAVMLGTGQRFVGDYTNNEAQYKALMQAGVEFGQAYHLNVGTALTAEQMRALTTDIVWLVEKTVTLPDGTTQQVLVPQIYLKSRASELRGDGTLISAGSTAIQTEGDVVNTGTITSRNVTLIDARNIRNHGGTLDGGTLALNARRDIDNLAGRISGGTVIAQAGRDIHLSSTAATGASQTGSVTTLAGVSSVNADNATLVAGRDIHANAASIRTTGDLALGAGRDINLGTVEVAQEEHGELDARNNYSLSRSAEIGSQIGSGGSTTIVAGRDVGAVAAYVNADGALAVSAGRDINVKAGEASAAVHDEHFTQSSGFLSKKSTHSIDDSARTEALGSTFSGNAVDMAAGRDLTIAGSTVAATHDVSLAAGNDMTITTSETASSAYSFKEEKRSGFGATGSGLSYGKRDQRDTIHDDGTQQTGSLVGSTDGSVQMKAGSTLTVHGSDLIAARDITGIGADVNIEAAQNRRHHDETHEVRQSGFTLGVSGGAIGAAINAGNKVNSATKSQDGRASALWSMAAARDAFDAASALGGPGGATAGAAVTLSWGTSHSKQTLTQDSTSHNGSRVQAGGTAAFVATGVDANGNQTAGNLNHIGSGIDANKVALGARNDVNIVSATDTDESHSTSKSSSASVGVSYGFGKGTAGFAVSASGSKAKGNADSVSATQANSHVSGKEAVTIVSGNDANIPGGVVSGGKVIADVGGNLNIASRQDTGESHARQQSVGGGISISQGGGGGSFSASKGKADGTYANVSEQSGIYAGDGGFDITVKGNTDLQGAVIASTATADKNSLTTGTLTWSDIANHSDYSATSMGIGGGGTFGNPNAEENSGPTSGKNTGGVGPMIPQHKSGSQDGVAQAAVAAGNITITDKASQTQDVATLRRDTANTNRQVGSNPDLENLLNKQADMMAAAQAAGEAVAKTVGQVADAKRDAALADAKAAQDTGDTALAQQYLADAESWNEGGSYRASLHAAGGALVAGLGGGNALAGGAGAAAASLAAPTPKKSPTTWPKASTQAIATSIRPLATLRPTSQRAASVPSLAAAPVRRRRPIRIASIGNWAMTSGLLPSN